MSYLNHLKEVKQTLIYQRVFRDIQIFIEIDEDLFEKFKSLFHSLFSSFSMHLMYSNKEIRKIRIYPCLKSADIENKHCCDYYIICNTDEENWVSSLIDFLEYCYQKILKCTVLHGSCVSINGFGVLILGNRRTGKSTLTHFLIDHKDVLFLDDDSVFVQKGSIIGFGFPIRLRNIIGNHLSLIGSYFDGEDQRYICNVKNNKKISDVKNISLIIFPEYKDKNGFETQEVLGSDLINYAINNLKDSFSLFESCEDLSCLLTNVRAFKVKYNNCESAVRFIMDLF